MLEDTRKSICVYIFCGVLSLAAFIICLLSNFWTLEGTGPTGMVILTSVACVFILVVGWCCKCKCSWKFESCCAAVFAVMYVVSMVVAAITASKFANVSPLVPYYLLVISAVISICTATLLACYVFAIIKAKYSQRNRVTDILSNWEDMGGQPWKRVNLPPNSKEYKRVLKLFNETLQINVWKIERIQNATLYNQFEEQKKKVTDALAGRRPNITRELFHGTDADKCDSICSQGFDRGYSGINGTLYGKGVYFATTAKYSDTFAKGNPNHMFLAEVITGEYCQGKPSMDVAPMQPNRSPFDSVVDNITNPSMFVVFKDTSAYPAYLVIYN